MTELAKPVPRGPKPRKRITSKRPAGSRTSRRRKQRKAKLKDADRLFSEVIRTRDGWACQACGSKDRPQCAHLVSRRYRATRWNPSNAICLCAGCHTRYTFDPLGWDEYLENYCPSIWREMRRLARLGVAKVDYDEVCSYLRGMLISLKANRHSL